MSLLMPIIASQEQVLLFIHQMASALEKFAESSSMLLLKTSCEFMMQSFCEEQDSIKVNTIFNVDNK